MVSRPESQDSGNAILLRKMHGAASSSPAQAGVDSGGAVGPSHVASGQTLVEHPLRAAMRVLTEQLLTSPELDAELERSYRFREIFRVFR